MDSETPPADTAQPLPWRSILRWNLLIVLWGIPLYGLHILVHELGHALAGMLVGLHAYGISFAFLTPIIESNSTAFQDFVVDTGGIALASLSAVLVLPFCVRLRPTLFKLALVIYCAVAIIHSALYITSGYYCQFGDFSNWKEAFPHMRLLMPLLVLGLPAVGYLLGGIYLPVQEAWLPASTLLRRWKITAFTLGLIGLLFSLGAGWVRQTFFHPALPSPYTFLIVSSFAMLLFAGGLPRLCDKRLFPAPVGPQRLPFKAFLLSLPLGVFIGLAWQKDLVFPHQQPGMWIAARYTDKVVAQDETRFSLCSDDQGNVLWLTAKDQPVRALSPDCKKTQIHIPGISPLRIKVRRQLIYLLGERHPAPCLATYDARHNELTVLLDGLEGAGAFDVAPNGDVYFSKGDNEVWLLSSGAKQAKLIWLAPQRISDIASGPSGLICIALSDGGFGESGQIYAIKSGGGRPQLIAGNLSNPYALEVDGQENICVGGAGWSSLCLIPATNRTERLILRGFGLVRHLALAPAGSIFYWPITGPRANHELRVLRPKQSRE